MAELEMLKYEAVGNDFLFLVDWERSRRFDAALARAACDRHRGVGADGLVRLSAPSEGGSFRMDLLNADGSAAETSGNGLRCAVICARDEGLAAPGEVLVETAAGAVPAVSDAPSSGASAIVRVGMGVPSISEENEASDPPDRRSFSVDVGNPHLVVLGDRVMLRSLDAVGPRISGAVPEGRNVDFACVREGADEIDLVVYERGVGMTLACGSGSVAVAAAARFAGLVGDTVVVHNPGGDLVVELGKRGGAWAATLAGPARRVARVVVDDDSLAEEVVA